MLTHAEMILRIAVGAMLGGVIGYERDRHGRPVGLRTHVLVALSAATFMVVSSQFAYYQHFRPDSGIEVDASRIAASVVSAIGFLAGGAILRTGTTVAGLTTAAGLWLVTAIGLCAGAGMFVESVASMLFGVLALTTLRRFEDKDDDYIKKRLFVEIGEGADTAVDRICAVIERLGGSVVEDEYERQFSQGRPYASLTMVIRLPIKLSVRQLMAALETESGIERLRIQSLH